jgi:hypothetical protein
VRISPWFGSVRRTPDNCQGIGELNNIVPAVQLGDSCDLT